MKTTIKSALLALTLAFMSTAWATPILFDAFDVTGQVTNSIGESLYEANEYAFTMGDGVKDSLVNDNPFSGIFAGSGAFAYDGGFVMKGFGQGASTAASWTVEFVALTAFEILFDYGTSGDASLSYGASVNGESIAFSNSLLVSVGDLVSIMFDAEASSGGYWSRTHYNQISTIPEPATLALIGLGLFGIAATRRSADRLPPSALRSE